MTWDELGLHDMWWDDKLAALAAVSRHDNAGASSLVNNMLHLESMLSDVADWCLHPSSKPIDASINCGVYDSATTTVPHAMPTELYPYLPTSLRPSNMVKATMKSAPKDFVVTPVALTISRTAHDVGLAKEHALQTYVSKDLVKLLKELGLLVSDISTGDLAVYISHAIEEKTTTLISLSQSELLSATLQKRGDTTTTAATTSASTIPTTTRDPTPCDFCKHYKDKEVWPMVALSAATAGWLVFVFCNWWYNRKLEGLQTETDLRLMRVRQGYPGTVYPSFSYPSGKIWQNGKAAFSYSRRPACEKQFSAASTRSSARYKVRCFETYLFTPIDYLNSSVQSVYLLITTC